MLVLIDSDPIVYRSGFAAESCTYELIAESPQGELAHEFFAPLPESEALPSGRSAGDCMKAWRAAHDDWEVLVKERHVKPEPKEHALHLVNQQIISIVREVSEKFKVEIIC
jgi:hypothetical protein